MTPNVSQNGTNTNLSLNSATNVAAISGYIQELNMESPASGWAIQRSNGKLAVLRTGDGGRSWINVSPVMVKDGVIVGAMFKGEKEAFVAQQAWPQGSGGSPGSVQLDRTTDGFVKGGDPVEQG